MECVEHVGIGSQSLIIKKLLFIILEVCVWSIMLSKFDNICILYLT